jgi:multiple antibiotic resistance protein
MNPPDALGAFLLAFPALFSIVNPVTGALIFREVTADRTHAGRVQLAGRVGTYSLLVMLAAMWLGSYVLAFFGISLAALRIAGGVVLALWAWGLLSAPEAREQRKQAEAAPVGDPGGEGADVAFFPLTLPFTTGPGTISVAVALGAGHPVRDSLPFFLGVSLAAFVMAVVIWVAYAQADRLSRLLGPSGSKTLTRLSAFLLFCIGVQLLVTGVSDALLPILHPGG